MYNENLMKFLFYEWNRIICLPDFKPSLQWKFQFHRIYPIAGRWNMDRDRKASHHSCNPHRLFHHLLPTIPVGRQPGVLFNYIEPRITYEHRYTYISWLMNDESLKWQHSLPHLSDLNHNIIIIVSMHYKHMP